MIALTLKEVAEAIGGALLDADTDAVASAVAIDSRAVPPRALFVALRGERVDGHSFARAALGAGAVAAIVSDAAATTGPRIVVPDTAGVLPALAAAVRPRLRARVVAITGSAGKTGTKDLTAAAVAAERRTHATVANFNNELGVPLTILGADEDCEVLVVEVGSRGIGHIAALMPIVRPDVAVVTNVGAAHVGMFGSVEATARAKGELVEALGGDGVAVLNAEDSVVAEMASRTRAAVVTYGRVTHADVRAEDVSLDDDARARFTLAIGDERAAVRLRTPGEHVVANALAAAAAAHVCGVSIDAIARGVSSCAPTPARMEVVDTPAGRRILNDAYNASPDSMAAALKTLAAMARARPSWAVLGYMAELGDQEVAAHDRIGRLAVRLRIGHLVTVGEEARAIHEGARLEGFFDSGDAVLVRDPDEAIALLRERLEPDAVVLVKASHAAGLERVARALVQEGDA